MPPWCRWRWTNCRVGKGGSNASPHERPIVRRAHHYRAISGCGVQAVQMVGTAHDRFLAREGCAIAFAHPTGAALRSYRHSTFLTSKALAPPGVTTSTLAPLALPMS